MRHDRSRRSPRTECEYIDLDSISFWRFCTTQLTTTETTVHVLIGVEPTCTSTWCTNTIVPGPRTPQTRLIAERTRTTAMVLLVRACRAPPFFLLTCDSSGNSCIRFRSKMRSLSFLLHLLQETALFPEAPSAATNAIRNKQKANRRTTSSRPSARRLPPHHQEMNVWTIIL